MQELGQTVAHWFQGHTIGITGVICVGLFFGGWFFRGNDKDSWKRDFSVAMVTGSCFALMSLLIQQNLETSNFKMTIAVTDDLTGFDANGRRLENATLSGKNLYRSRLKGARLAGADLSTAYLGEAKLQDAHLELADLSYAILFRADLEDAHLQGANLQGAEISTGISNADLRGARVHRETCWQIALEKKALWVSADQAVATPADQLTVDRLTASGLVPSRNDPKTLGHVCDIHERTRPLGRQSGESDKQENPRIYVCQDGSLRVRSTQHREHPCD